MGFIKWLAGEPERNLSVCYWLKKPIKYSEKNKLFLPETYVKPIQEFWEVVTKEDFNFYTGSFEVVALPYQDKIVGLEFNIIGLASIRNFEETNFSKTSILMGISETFKKLGVKADLDKERSGHFDLEEKKENSLTDFGSIDWGKG